MAARKAIKVSDAMKDAGEAVFYRLHETFPDRLLVAKIYIAMLEAKCSEEAEQKSQTDNDK